MICMSMPWGADDLPGVAVYLSAFVDFALLCSAGTPSMNSGVRRALGPGLRSLRRVNSLHGGADHKAPSKPLEATRSKRRYCALSRMLKVELASRSKGCRQSACNASMALVSAALMPAKRSRKSFGDDWCFGVVG